MDKKTWHAPHFQLLDAARTAVITCPEASGGLDRDVCLADPNGLGDLPETSETHTWIPFAGGNLHHAQADS